MIAEQWKNGKGAAINSVMQRKRTNVTMFFFYSIGVLDIVNQ